jgi:hypothetical protein
MSSPRHRLTNYRACVLPDDLHQPHAVGIDFETCDGRTSFALTVSQANRVAALLQQQVAVVTAAQQGR